MNLDFTEEQEILRSTIKKMCEDCITSEVVRELENDPQGYSEEFWNALTEMGIHGMAIPEQYGGLEMGLLDLVIVYEQFGRVLAATPHFVSSVLAASVLSNSATEQQKESWLPRIAEGDAIVIPAWLEANGSAAAEGIRLQAEVNGSGYSLNGNKEMVAFASSADQLLVLVRRSEGEDGLLWVLVDPKAEGVSLEFQKNHADQALYRVSFDQVPVSEESCLSADKTAWQSWNDTMLKGAVLASAQAVGGAERMLEMTVQYSMERSQFGKFLGEFQALAHYMADCAVHCEGSRILTYQAAWAFDNERAYEQLALTAKLKSGQMFRDMTADCVQIHGGLGFTSEADPQLYYRRAKQDQLMYWDPAYLEKRIAGCVLDN